LTSFPGSPFAAIQFRDGVVELMEQAGELVEGLVAVRLVVHQTRHEALSALIRRTDRGQIR